MTDTQALPPEPRTLGEWRVAAAAFGWTNGVAFLDKKIAEQGADAEVVAHSSQVINLLANMPEQTEGRAE